MICVILSIRRLIPIQFRSIPMFFLLLIAACGLATADMSESHLAPCRLTNEEADGVNGDAGKDVHAIPNFKKTISGLLQAQKFDQLDCLANSARSNKETFPGGMWKLRTIYSGLETPLLHATEKDWATHISRLRRWVAARPHSITGRVALAESYTNYGWDARGHGSADFVSQSGWQLFEKRAAEARQILDRASSLPNKCPDWYVAMQQVALAQGWTRAAKRSLFQQAVKFEPAYYYYYRIYANSILPQWDGEEGEVEKFAQETADHIGGDAGDILYFQLAASLVCCQTEQLKLSWPRIQRGFDALEKRSGTALENWNLLARMATIFNDVVVANKMIALIGDQWSDAVWGSSSYFESVKRWAKQVTPYLEQKTPPEESAEANLLTREGRSYKAALDEKFRAFIPACLRVSASLSPAKFKLLYKIGKDGMLDQVVTIGAGEVGSCLSRKLLESRQNNQTAFPPPPTPDYWVKFEFDLSDSTSAAVK